VIKERRLASRSSRAIGSKAQLSTTRKAMISEDIKRLMIEKLSGRVAYAVMSFGGFLGMGSEEHTIPGAS
jgi:hypothetical protein